MLKNSRKCLTNGSKVCKIARVLSKQHKNEWDLSSAGRASALQAEGHRFEPYRSHFYGGIAQLARAFGSYPVSYTHLAVPTKRVVEDFGGGGQI